MKTVKRVTLLLVILMLHACGADKSADGGSAGTIQWGEVNSPTTTTLSKVVWTGKEFVAFGNKVRASSVDGLTWTAQATTAAIEDAVWDGTKFVGVAKNTVWGTYIFGVSNDGVAWTETLNAGARRGTIDSSLVAANGKILALGMDSTGAGVTYLSTDGVTWTVSRNNTAAKFTAVIWDGRKYVAIGNAVDGSTGTAASSVDGITWQSVALPTTASLKSIASDGNRYVVTSPGNVGSDVYTTTDGKNWARVALSGPHGTMEFGNKIIWTGNKFVGVGWWSRVMSSKDGSTWTEETSRGQTPGGLYSYLYDVAYSGTTYVAVGYDGKIMCSAAGGKQGANLAKTPSGADGTKGGGQSPDALYWQTQIMHRGVEAGNGNEGGVTYHGR